MGLDGKKDVHLGASTIGSVSRLEVLEGPSGRRTRSEAEKARIVAESLLPGAQVSEVARKHGATRWQIYDWRRRFRQRGALPSRESPATSFTPMVVEEPLEERRVPVVGLEIAINDASGRISCVNVGVQIVIAVDKTAIASLTFDKAELMRDQLKELLTGKGRIEFAG